MRLELKRIGRFLGVESKYLTEYHLRCIEENSKGKFQENTTVQADEVSSFEVREFIKVSANEIKSLSVEKFGYSPDFDWND